MNGGEPAPPLPREDIATVLRGAHPEIRKLLRLAHDQGFQVLATKGNHYKVMTPKHWREKESVFSPKTPSDIRGIHRVARKLRHLGVNIPHK